MSRMQWNIDFCSLNNCSKKNHFNVVLFFIGYFNRENYVATWFSLPQGKKNQMVDFVFFFALNLDGHPIPLTVQAKKNQP